MEPDGSTPADGRTEWEGYSDYHAVSKSVGKSVSKAIENYAWLDAILRDNGNPKPDQIAMARSAVLAAALKLFVEMREEKCKNGNDDYDDILTRWTGSDDLDKEDLFELAEGWDGVESRRANGSPAGDVMNGGQNDAKGYIRAFQTVDLDDQVPPWTLQFVTDIRTAGWRLGYLQAGRRSKKPAEDPVQAEAEHMLRGE